MKKVISVLAIVGLATPAFGVDFFGNAGTAGFQGNLGGLSGSPVLSDSLRGLETLWSSGGFLPGSTSYGDIIGVSSPNTVSTPQTVYRVDNALSGAPSLVAIGSIPTANAVSDLTVGNGKLFGSRISGAGGTIIVYELDTTFGIVNTYDTGISIINTGQGGIAYDASSDSFYLTDPDNDKLWNWSIGGSATLVGTNAFDFDNNDLAIDPNTGTLYGAIENVATGAWEVGIWSKNTGQFTASVSVAGVSGSTGLAIPTPATLALVGLGGLVAGRRRR